jgi:hypothetical protein
MSAREFYDDAQALLRTSTDDHRASDTDRLQALALLSIAASLIEVAESLMVILEAGEAS